jgi:glycerol-3-phosphate dehydrogenase
MTTRSTQVLVIGGGATGLGVAWDACLRGLSVTLIEQGDLGQGTSGRYHGLLHSGGRYVVSDPATAVDCCHENALLRRVIPGAIEPTGGFFVSTQADSPEFAAEWLAACRRLGLPVDEIGGAAALRREPLLTPRLSRVFEVQDAALDSFELLHALARGVQQAGGAVLLRHRVSGLVPHRPGMLARIVSLGDESAFQIEAEFVVNAAGPFAGAVAAMAGAHLPLALGKGTMVAMASRLTHTVLNRCKPPHDGDVIVPVGTVCILGTTDVPVRSPADLAIEPWEIDLLLGEGQILIPTLRRHRALRAWAGIRALHRPTADRASSPPRRDSHPGGDRSPAPSEAAEAGGYPGEDRGANRALARSHVVVDHESTDGVPGLVTIIGGKLTTFRKMAEDVVDHLAGASRVGKTCRTASTSLPAVEPRYYALGDRPARLRAASPAVPGIVCECELVTRQEVENALHESGSTDLDDLRRDLRLGMGPCQGAFCAYRAAAVAASVLSDPSADGGLANFAQERWRGLRPLAWGRGLRQAEMLRRIQVELLGAHSAAADDG